MLGYPSFLLIEPSSYWIGLSACIPSSSRVQGDRRDLLFQSMKSDLLFLSAIDSVSLLPGNGQAAKNDRARLRPGANVDGSRRQVWLPSGDDRNEEDLAESARRDDLLID